MKERFKKTITYEILQKDMTDQLRLSGSALHNSRGVLAAILAFAGLALTIDLTVFYEPWCGGIAFLITVGAVIWCLVPRKISKIQSVSREDILFFQDTVVDKKMVLRRKRGGFDYYLIFRKLGPVLVTEETPGLGLRESYPPYRTTQPGATFFVARYQGPETSGKGALVFYAPDSWRLRKLTDQEIEEEIRQEELLLEKLLNCQRSPRLNMRKLYFTESPHAYWVPAEKTKADMDLLERFAAYYFGRDLVSAAEFIVRYCPIGLHEEAQRDFTPQQLLLCEIVTKYVEKDEAAEQRRETKNKIVDTLLRRDQYE